MRYRHSGHNERFHLYFFRMPCCIFCALADCHLLRRFVSVVRCLVRDAEIDNDWQAVRGSKNNKVWFHAVLLDSEVSVEVVGCLDSIGHANCLERALHHVMTLVSIGTCAPITRVGMVQLSLMLRIKLEARRQVDFAEQIFSHHSCKFFICDFVVTCHRRDVEPRVHG